MTTEPSAFLDSGYAVMPGFLDAGDLPRLGEAVAAVMASLRHAGMCRRPGNDLLPLRWDEEIVARILGSGRAMRLLRDVLLPPDLKWISGYVSTKPPGSAALWWHQDWWCWDHPASFRRAPAQVAVLCYLAATGSDSGALRVLPGSHHASMAMHAILPEAHGEAASGLPANHAAMADAHGQVTLCLQPGDAVVLDYRLLHGTHANNTSRRRDCIILSFAPAWRELPWEIMAHLITHPALPAPAEAVRSAASRFAGLMPAFEGKPASLAVNRVPPARYSATA